MKGHTQIGELLALYRDLSDADRREVEEHAQACTACAARLGAYRRMDWDLGRLADPRPDERLRKEFYAATSVRGAATSVRGATTAVRGATIAVGGRQGRWFEAVHSRLRRVPALAGQMVELTLLVLVIAGLGFALRGPFQPPAAPTPLPSPSLSSGGMPLTADAPAEAPNLVRTTDMLRAENPVLELPPALEKLIPPTGLQERSGLREHFVLQEHSGLQEHFATQVGAQGGEGGVYIVLADDSLWNLAEKYLGDGRRFDEIVQATQTKRAEDSTFAMIEDPSLILPGFKLWIPAPGAPPMAPEPAPVVSAEPAATATAPPQIAGGPTGHIAFSFWNDHPARCTYEINVIDVAACLASSEACQATRRIFSLNNASEPALSPDGARLAFRGWGEPPSEDSPYLNCAPPVPARYLVNTTLDGTDFRGTGGFWEDSHPDWAPDGQQLLFDTRRHGDRIARILLINTDGSDERDLYIAGQHPSWAPDGQRFVYRGCDLTGNRCGLWLAYAAPVKSWEVGTNMIGPVIQDDQAAHPDWSPTSDEIVYQSPTNGSWDLYVAALDGGAPQQLTADPTIEGLPTWSPDGQWVAYLSDGGGNWGIWIIRADGSQRHLLFPFDGGIFTPKAVEPYGQRDWINEQISWAE